MREYPLGLVRATSTGIYRGLLGHLAFLISALGVTQNGPYGVT